MSQTNQLPSDVCGGIIDPVSEENKKLRAALEGLSFDTPVGKMTIDPKTQRSKIANVTGGLSGPAVKPVAVRMVYQVASVVKIPVIGMGGISGLQDALEFFMAGASAIQVGTAVFSTPSVVTDLIDDLGIWLDSNGYDSLGDIVGVANPAFHARA